MRQAGELMGAIGRATHAPRVKFALTSISKPSWSPSKAAVLQACLRPGQSMGGGIFPGAPFEGTHGSDPYLGQPAQAHGARFLGAGRGSEPWQGNLRKPFHERKKNISPRGLRGGPGGKP